MDRLLAQVQVAGRALTYSPIRIQQIMFANRDTADRCTTYRYSSIGAQQIDIHQYIE
jgi:hypothetical protein